MIADLKNSRIWLYLLIASAVLILLLLRRPVIAAGNFNCDLSIIIVAYAIAVLSTLK